MTTEDPASIPPYPGSCALRITNLHYLSSRAKRTLLRSIASDITATFILIAQHAEKGVLGRKHTEPINSVIEKIKETECSQRVLLEDSVRKYKRRVRRMRREKVWMRGKLGRVVKGIHEMIGMWRERARRFEGIVEELGAVRRECEMLRARGVVAVHGLGVLEGDAKGDGMMRIASPMDVDVGAREVRGDGSEEGSAILV